MMKCWAQAIIKRWTQGPMAQTLVRLHFGRHKPLVATKGTIFLSNGRGDARTYAIRRCRPANCFDVHARVHTRDGGGGFFSEGRVRVYARNEDAAIAFW